jgi:NADP-dependent 3-hydroxy acid dehydrogenase YdfG
VLNEKGVLMELKNKVACITGASKGIGRAITLALAREGVSVAISARGKESLETVAREVRALGAEVYAFPGDMSVEEEIKSFISGSREKMGRLDILVNNAGFGHFKPIAEFSTKDWDDMFNLNVRGLFIATREALPFLREAGESVIVNVASLAGKNAFVNGGGYSATKHAVLGFSRCLMLEERKKGVRVLAICPGSVATSFFDDHHGTMDPKRDKIIHAEDVADSVIHMLKLPQRAMVSEIDIRPSDPS